PTLHPPLKSGRAVPPQRRAVLFVDRWWNALPDLAGRYPGRGVRPRAGAPAQNAFRFAILSAAIPGAHWLTQEPGKNPSPVTLLFRSVNQRLCRRFRRATDWTVAWRRAPIACETSGLR